MIFNYHVCYLLGGDLPPLFWLWRHPRPSWRKQYWCCRAFRFTLLDNSIHFGGVIFVMGILCKKKLTSQGTLTPFCRVHILWCSYTAIKYPKLKDKNWEKLNKYLHHRALSHPSAGSTSHSGCLWWTPCWRLNDGRFERPKHISFHTLIHVIIIKHISIHVIMNPSQS